MAKQETLLKAVTKRPPKTIKEKKFVKALIENEGNATKAALEAYDTKNYQSAATIGKENLKKLQISDLMDKMGLTDDHMVKVLKEGMNAKRELGAETDPKTGKLKRRRSIPDHAIRHKFLETGLKLKKHLGDEAGGGGPSVVVIPILGGASHGIIQPDDGDKENPALNAEN